LYFIYYLGVIVLNYLRELLMSVNANVNLKGLEKSFYKDINVNDVLKEAIMNSIQADATEIKIELQYEYEKGFFDTSSKDKGALVSIIIKDNGEGFTEENIKSFLELWTRKKEDIGGKGIGRFSYLKLAHKVEIESVSRDRKHIKFIMDEKLFEKKNLDEYKKDTNEEKSYTRITLSDLKNKSKKEYDSCFNSIEEIFKLFLFTQAQKRNKNIVISISDGNQIRKIDSKDIKTLTPEPDIYKSKDVEFNIYTFKNTDNSGIYIYYCSNELKVKPITIAKNFEPQYIFAITSDYFDKKSNNERTDIDLKEDFSQEDSEIKKPEEDYENQLKQKCFDIVKKNEPDLKSKNQKKIEYINNNYGYISTENINKEDLCLDDKDIVNKYRDNQNKKEDDLINKLGKDNLNLEAIAKEVSDQNKLELAKYIFHRDIIARKGDKLTFSKEKEEVLHNLFFPQQSGNNRDMQINLYNNSIWLLDDKFMSYSYIASDKTISAISQEISQASSKSSLEPDLFITYNKPEKDTEFKDAVLVEFKRGNINYKEKLSAIDQVDEYKNKLEKLELNIRNFYCYIICDFNGDDKDLERGMTNRSFIKVYSNYGCIYYGYLLGSKTHITFISSSSVFADAIARNKAFLDILKS
jgi:hypothetical protein